MKNILFTVTMEVKLTDVNNPDNPELTSDDINNFVEWLKLQKNYYHQYNQTAIEILEVDIDI